MTAARTLDAGAPAAFLAGGGEMAAVIRATDWSKTPLGPIDTWSQTLRTIVSFVLANRFPMLLWWGPDYVSIYNEAYRPILGNKHPGAMGLPFRECWPEIRHIIEPLIDTPFKGGPATWMEDILLEINRHGFFEETHFTVAYSPVPDETAPRGIGGVLATVHEITEKVVAERRVTVLRDLGAQVSEAKTAEDACAIAGAALAPHARDMPFALLYLMDGDGKHARLAGTAGTGTGEAISPAAVALDAEPGAVWPLAAAAREQAMITVDDLAARFSQVPAGPWSDPPGAAVVVPVRATKAHELAGFLVAGISSRLRLDDLYRSFLELVAGQIATAIATARAYEEERRRIEALTEIDRAKTLFFSNVSHEFRTPLTLMLGPLEDAIGDLAQPLVPGQRERIAMAQRNGLRLQKLVNALLDFSRVEAGRIRAVYQPTDLAAFTHDLASNFRSACDKAGLALGIEAAPLPHAVYVDREMWEKIVLNLVSNAFKFTLKGGITVSVTAEGDHAVLRVADTGTGIPEAEVPLIFERFHRVEGAKGRTHEGTGIGLALVRELVKLHAGEVACESALGAGTIFTVRLPFGRAHLPSEQIDGARGQVSTATRADAFVSEALRWLPEDVLAEGGHGAAVAVPDAPAGARPRVLFADDNADMRDYVRRLLGPHYEVTVVADGAQALAEIRRARPDLVVSDVMMPVLDGAQLVTALRTASELSDIPVILLSARAGEEAKVEGLRTGADDYLVKPFSARELLARIAANLKLARARAETLRLERDNAERLRLLNETLEQRVAEEVERRTKTEEALRQAQKMEAIGQLTGGIAHDFNNLLQVMLGNLDKLYNRFDFEGRQDIKKPIESALRSAERAAQLTNQLLAFARRQPLEPVAVDLGKLVVTMSEMLRRTLGEKIEVETVLSGGLWKVAVDVNQLESTVLNLAVNARDAMPAGGKLTIETANAHLDDHYVEAHADVTAGQYVLIAVSDTGIGMPREIIHKAFEPFFTTKEIGKGTGLGLAQVYGFVKQTGGHVKIYSEVGQGTTVKIYLPRLLNEDNVAPPPNPVVELPRSLAGDTVLVVEDDELVRGNTAEMLRELGYETVEAPDAEAALDLLDRHASIKLLFTDVGLPGGMNGRRLADEALRRRPALKVLFTSGYSRNAIVHHGRLDRGVDLLSKPFTFAALAAKLRAVLSK